MSKKIHKYNEFINENWDYKEKEFYDHILPGHEDIKPEDVARQMDWSQIKKSKQRLAFMQYHDTVDGIDIWYCYGTDDYYFSDADGEN